MHQTRVLNYDFKQLPECPFSVFFYNEDAEVSPKRIFTVTGKVINQQKQKIELFIQERNELVEYNPLLIKRVQHFFVN